MIVDWGVAIGTKADPYVALFRVYTGAVMSNISGESEVLALSGSIDRTLELTGTIDRQLDIVGSIDRTLDMSGELRGL